VGLYQTSTLSTHKQTLNERELYCNDSPCPRITVLRKTTKSKASHCIISRQITVQCIYIFSRETHLEQIHMKSFRQPKQNVWNPIWGLKQVKSWSSPEPTHRRCASEIVDHVPFAEALFPWQNKEQSSLIRNWLPLIMRAEICIGNECAWMRTRAWQVWKPKRIQRGWSRAIPPPNKFCRRIAFLHLASF